MEPQSNSNKSKVQFGNDPILIRYKVVIGSSKQCTTLKFDQCPYVERVNGLLVRIDSP